MTTLRSDEGRRDNALRGRGIETDRFPTATFELTGPFELSREPVRARGRLTLHGETQPIIARVSGQRSGDAIELAGSAPIEFAASASSRRASPASSPCATRARSSSSCDCSRADWTRGLQPGARSADEGER